MKKLVCVLGSPRPEGNSAAIADRLGRLAEEQGFAVEKFNLNALKYRGCQACMACKGKVDYCAVQDGLTPVLDAAAKADVLLLASPVYYGDLSSQLKGFVDRTYSYLIPGCYGKSKPSRLEPGHKLIMVLTQGFRGDKSFAGIFPKYRGFFKHYGFKEARVIRQCGEDAKGSTALRDKAFAEAEEIAKEFFR